MAFFSAELGIRPWEWDQLDLRDALHLIKVAQATINARKRK